MNTIIFVVFTNIRAAKLLVCVAILAVFLIDNIAVRVHVVKGDDGVIVLCDVFMYGLRPLSRVEVRIEGLFTPG